MRKITPEMGEFIIENHKGTSHKAMAAMLKERFGVEMSMTPVARFYRENGLSSGLTGRFQKGHVSANKGRKWDEYMSPEGQKASRATCFKKGNVPWNAGVPVGTVRARRNDGRRTYLFEKAGQPNRWRMHHVMVWERAHGPMPEGCMVTFADGDPMNCSIDNLVLETKAQHAVKCRWGIRGHDRETVEAANAWADLKMLARRKRRERER